MGLVPRRIQNCTRKAGYYDPVEGWVSDYPKLSCRDERRDFTWWERKFGSKRCGLEGRFFVRKDSQEA